MFVVYEEADDEYAAWNCDISKYPVVFHISVIRLELR